ncbi:DUF4194 domain-containing protein [Bullifex sp.]|uniref:DUF4194 domain-containing protein n=1 Tax=Bullifex sp. TaxID=2815808 RepID=UPI002A8200D5|nr:DUF4194 domain-containing protein [Bullifex sp.]MDY4067548.1 DUF4194 domain-containing protein [Bullifex sp.]
MVNTVQEWSKAAILLLKGPVYENDDRKIWAILLRCRENIDNYFRVIGLHVLIEEEDGYAYLEQIKDSVEKGMESEEEVDETLPRLIRKIPFSYKMSMLLVLLRQEMDKFSSSMNESSYPILHKREIMGLVKSFTKEASDQTKFNSDVDNMINKLVELTYLKPKEKLLSSKISDEAEFELSPIIKSKINANVMKEMLEKLNKNEEEEK